MKLHVYTGNTISYIYLKLNYIRNSFEQMRMRSEKMKIIIVKRLLFVLDYT